MTLICYFGAAALNLFWLWRGDELFVSVQMALPVLTVVVAGIGVLHRSAALTVPERERYRRRAMWALLAYYMAILSVLLFFGGLFHLDRGGSGAVNLEPFYTIRRYLIHYKRTGSLYSLSNLLGNVVILVPLGILVPVMFWPLRRFWLALPLMALLAVGVEYLQWCTGTGVADVDDSILNFAGAAAGYVVTRLCQMICVGIKGEQP